MALIVGTGITELKIAGVSMHTPAWRVRFADELQFPPDVSGQYFDVPGMDGALPVPLFETSATYDMPFILVGDVDHTGAKYAPSGGYTARRIGFTSNMNYLLANVCTGRQLTGDRTRAATLQLAGEAQARTADVHVNLIPPSRNIRDFNAFAWSCILRLRIPDGMFR